MKYISLILLLVLVACGVDNAEKGDKIVEQGSAPELTRLDSLSQAIIDSPNDANTYYRRALFFQDEGEYDQAIADIDRALVIDSTVAEFYYCKGDIYYQDQRFKDAFENFQICVEYDNEHELALLKLSQIELVLKQYDLAIEMVNRVLKVNPMNGDAYYLKGFIYLDAGDTATAVSTFRTAIEVDPQHYDSFVMLGEVYAGVNDEYAENYYDQALAIQPNSIEALYNKGMLYQNADRYMDAYPLYDRIIEIDSASYFAYYNRGYMLLVSDSSYTEAIDEFEKSLVYYPYYVQAIYNIGLCYENLDELDKAKIQYEKTLELDPQNDLAARGMSRILEN